MISQLFINTMDINIRRVVTTHDGNINIIFAHNDLNPFNKLNSLKMKTLTIPLLRILVVKNIGTERDEIRFER